MSSGAWRGPSLAPTRWRDEPSVEVRPDVPDAEWDAFVLSSRRASYRQSAAWATFRQNTGWTATRIAVPDDRDRLIGGMQLLIRPVPLLGAVGYVEGGPLVRSGDTATLHRCLEELDARCRSARVRYLALTPAHAEPWYLEILAARGFVESPQFDSPRATVCLDLDQRHETLLGQMSRSTRANVRRGISRGLRAREGSATDLPLFYELLTGAAARKGFTVRPKRHYVDLYESFAAVRRAHLFVVESDDESVSAQFSLSTGDTFHTCFMAWSGSHGDRKPNHLLEWTAICWAKKHGLTFYDFGGIDHVAAKASGAGGGTDDWISPYKLSFGGRVMALPPTYERVQGDLLNWGYSTLLPRIERIPSAARAKRRLVRKVSGR